MSTDQEGAREYKLRFQAGRFEASIVSVIMVLQLGLVAVSLMLFAFVLISRGWFEPELFGVSLIPLVIAYLLTHLYEEAPR